MELVNTFHATNVKYRFSAWYQ